jgi:hypothetical protein
MLTNILKHMDSKFKTHILYSHQKINFISILICMDQKNIPVPISLGALDMEADIL